jgi:hypothetical protein
LYPNDASKLVVVAGNVEGEISGQPPILEYRVGSPSIILLQNQLLNFRKCITACLSTVQPETFTGTLFLL